MKDFFSNLKTVIMFYILGMIISFLLYFAFVFFAGDAGPLVGISIVAYNITNSLFIMYITALLLTNNKK
ncbi:hypothetical protein [uncultured Catenibacterium sp.]|uniref:hypothetical protein n=1 Tax=uncultured Catenibacterium sp. TaxID=286142 RepID=UPI0025ED4030|nr:hypothetical protein [uncultured Catenibacterium sp.]